MVTSVHSGRFGQDIARFDCPEQCDPLASSFRRGPVGSQAPHAAGVAYAFKYRKQARTAVCFLGDGATSKGDVWEAMNFSGVWKLPVVFVINNNQWAISVPLKTQTASKT
jgi:TPP-dependent pyruvate/acetoin dehydrogenase alpha subunit